MLDRHSESTAMVTASPALLFDHLDRHDRLAGHMTGSSWMMAGGSMRISTDALQGREIGSKIRLEGRALGLPLFVEEVITQHDVPRRKVWATVGTVRLVVIGSYRMGFEITPHGMASRLRVFIDYELPPTGIGRWLGKALGAWYARWCTDQMVGDAVREFAHVA
jgi:hypothetical protein